MNKVKKLFAILLMSITFLVATASVAFADPPGPGSKQCTPGQQGNPHPGFKGGSC
jgi:hypothetical protein